MVRKLNDDMCNAETEMRDIIAYLQNNEDVRHMIWIEIKNNAVIRIQKSDKNDFVNNQDCYR